MNDDPAIPEPGSNRLKRQRWPFVLVAIALLLVAGALAIRQFVRPEKLTALLVNEVHTRLGAQLELGGDVRFGFWPGLRVELPNAVLRGKPADQPFLTTKSIEVAIPWRSLWADTLVIEKVELDAPKLDLDALNEWLKTLPETHGSADFRVAVDAHDGQLVRGTTRIADGVDLEFAGGSALSAWLAQFGANATTPATALIPPLIGSMQAKEMRVGDTHLKDVRIEIDNGAALPAQDGKP